MYRKGEGQCPRPHQKEGWGKGWIFLLTHNNYANNVYFSTLPAIRTIFTCNPLCNNNTYKHNNGKKVWLAQCNTGAA